MVIVFTFINFKERKRTSPEKKRGKKNAKECTKDKRAVRAAECTVCEYFLMACCSFDLSEVLGKCSDVMDWNRLPVESMEIFK